MNGVGPEASRLLGGQPPSTNEPRVNSPWKESHLGRGGGAGGSGKQLAVKNYKPSQKNVQVVEGSG